MTASIAERKSATGWTPGIPWEQTLLDILDDWRGRVASVLP